MKQLNNTFKSFLAGLVLVSGTLFNSNAYAQCGWNQGAAQCQEQIQIQEDQTRRNNSGYYENGSNNSAPVYAPPKASKYGAVAMDGKAGVFGYSVGQPSKNLAKQEAIKDCNSNGCKVISNFANICASSAWGIIGKGGMMYVRSHLDPKIADSQALSACNTEASNCKIIMSECSLP